MKIYEFRHDNETSCCLKFLKRNNNIKIKKKDIFFIDFFWTGNRIITRFTILIDTRPRG